MSMMKHMNPLETRSKDIDKNLKQNERDKCDDQINTEFTKEGLKTNDDAGEKMEDE